MGQEGAERLARDPGQADRDRVVGQAGMAVPLGDLAREHGAHGAVHVDDLAFDHDRLLALQRDGRGGDQVLVERGFEAVILALGPVQGGPVTERGLVEQLGKVDALRLPVRNRLLRLHSVDPAGHFRDGAEAHLGHDRAQFLGDEEEVVDHVLGRAGEARAQHRVLGGDADRAGVEMALAHHDAARRDQRGGGEADFVRAEQDRDRYVAPGADAAVGLDRDAAAQVVEQQGLLGLGQADLPGRACVGQRGQRRSAGAAFVARDRHVVGARLGDARGDRADPDFGDQLDRDPRVRVDVLQVVDQLGQILDRVDVMVRRGRDQADAGGRVPGGADGLVEAE